MKLCSKQILWVRITGILDFFHRPVFYKIENTTFRKLDLFPSSSEGGKRTQLGSLERANLNKGQTWVGLEILWVFVIIIPYVSLNAKERLCKGKFQCRYMDVKCGLLLSLRT
jgi:hypothetical protein